MKTVMIMSDYFNYNDEDISMHYTRDERPIPSDFRMHTHVTYELYCFEEGSGVYWVEGTPYPLKKGDILIMRPAEAHYIAISADQPYSRLSINFTPSLLDRIDPSRKLLDPFEKRERGTYNLYRAEDFSKSAYNTLIGNIIAPCADRRLQTLTNLLPLLYEIYRSFDSIAESEAERSLGNRIIRYVNRHIAEEISLGHLCSKFFISESQLGRLFKKATGSTVWNYITAKRLVNARSRILAGERPSEVYLKCGFNDYSVFYRAYKKKYGEPPSAAR